MTTGRATHPFLACMVMLWSSCADLLGPREMPDRNLEDFEAAWRIAATHYPFFAFKEVNWDSLYVAFRPGAVQARGDEIYPLLFELFLPLRDGHIEIQTEAGYPMVNYRWPRAKDIAAYSPMAARNYCRHPLHVAGKSNFEYGLIDDAIGYVHFTTFAQGDWVGDVDYALDHLSSTRGLVIDVRNNFGGSSTSYDYVLARFIDRPLVETLYFRDGHTQSWTVQPATTSHYGGRVVILINGGSFSAAEIFTELMRQMPRVTVVGDTSGGGGASAELFALPSGKKLKLPVKFARRFDGQMIEWNGIVPDVVVEQTPADVRRGRDLQLEAAITFLRGQTPR